MYVHMEYKMIVLSLTLVQLDGRNRLSNFWTPTGGLSNEESSKDDGHSLLLRGGFLRQAHSGVFHLLPLGLRVQNKLEQYIDKHMTSIGISLAKSRK
jgi:prolyl-tRNA synthetase